MTENEAIEVLSNELIVITDMIGYCRDFEKESDLALAYRVKRKEAHKIAITALKEIQQYREIGTVEEIKQAIGVLSLSENDIIETFHELNEYRKIGTVNECREAVEKQKPKPCEFYGDEEDGKLLCPNCGEDLWDLKECGFNNCPYCGQAILWENLEGMEDE